MSAYQQPKQDNAFGRFLLISFILHLIVVVFYPQWQVGSLSGNMPGDGALQFSLRDAPGAQTVSSTVSETRQQVPAVPTVSPPTPQPRPAEVLPEPTPAPPAIVEQVPSVPQPEVMPKPAPTQPDPVQVAQTAPPQPVPRPQTPPEPVQPQPVDRPVVESPPVITSDAGSVPVAAPSEGVSETVVSGDGDGDVNGVVEGVAEAEVPVAPAQPAPPPPPPAVGSMLRLPGGQYLPKNLEDISTQISVRVLITVDEHGNIVASEIDPATRSTIPQANEFALNYAQRLVQAEPGPEGQAYQAAFVVTFDPHAVDPRTGGVVSTTDPDEQIQILGTD